MAGSPRHKLFVVLTAVFGLSAAALGAMGMRMIYVGAYPPPGEGSLGHVGVTVFGGGAVFVSLILGLFAYYFLIRIRP
jgi:hypothetical protein